MSSSQTTPLSPNERAAFAELRELYSELETSYTGARFLMNAILRQHSRPLPERKLNNHFEDLRHDVMNTARCPSTAM